MVAEEAEQIHCCRNYKSQSLPCLIKHVEKKNCKVPGHGAAVPVKCDFEALPV
jgi:hypothetical protein